MSATDPVRNTRLGEGLRLLAVARRLLEVPSPDMGEAYAKWWDLFGDDAETVQRAANNLLYGHYLSDSNLTAAADIGERIAALLDHTA